MSHVFIWTLADVFGLTVIGMLLFPLLAGLIFSLIQKTYELMVKRPLRWVKKKLGRA